MTTRTTTPTQPTTQPTNHPTYQSTNLPIYQPTDQLPHHDTVAILDFGAQYSQLIARRVREGHVYCELFPCSARPEKVLALKPKGFILSGGPASVYEPGAPRLPGYVLESGQPVLGICYGMQLLAQGLGGRVAPASEREYGPAELIVSDPASPLFAGLPSSLQVWMSHGDRVEALPPGFSALAVTDNSPVAAMGHRARGLYGVQFHPEVTHTPLGQEILDNFLLRVCGCQADWTPSAFIEESVARIRAQVGGGQVALGLSGGVDSAVTAKLIHRAVGDQLTCIFVDTGLLRRGEPAQVVRTFQGEQGMRLIPVNATEEFLAALEGVADPAQKRQIIGEKFIRIFEREARRLGQIDFLGQGTIYPDVIESAGTGRGGAAVIKRHHNVGGLPPDMDFELVEPLRNLFKDEVRQVGEQLGLPRRLVWRHPFPGPGLAVRVLGEVTWERLETLRQADAILLHELEASGWYDRAAQAFAVLLPEARSTGVAGDSPSFGQTIVLRAVVTDDFMTASPAELPYELLTAVSAGILNEVPDVTRVVYDLSTKPPATIEWL
jgi:GMP synthase (glutamine-hydrolysing)